MRRFVLAFPFLLLLGGCEQLLTGCWEEDLEDCENFGDEADDGFTEECGQPMFADGMALMNVNACSPVFDRIVSEFGVVPFTYAVEDCGYIPESEQWDCFGELQLLNTNEPPIRCGFCPNYAENTNPPQLCWRHPSEWLAATLQGHVTLTTCEDIDPPLGSDVGYTLPADCPDNFACLGGLDRCSCKCRDEQGNDVGYAYESDFFAHWWEPYLLPDVPPLIEGVGYPVEATCTGEPLTWTYEGSYGHWVGTTIELDGFDPVYPPNGELHHTPLWELTTGLAETSAGLSVSASFVAAAMLYPNELQYGAHVKLVAHERKPALQVDACELDSFCDLAGLTVGDLLVGGDIDGNTLRLDVVDVSGSPRIVVITVTP